MGKDFFKQVFTSSRQKNYFYWWTLICGLCLRIRSHPWVLTIIFYKFYCWRQSWNWINDCYAASIGNSKCRWRTLKEIWLPILVILSKWIRCQFDGHKTLKVYHVKKQNYCGFWISLILRISIKCPVTLKFSKHSTRI